jgi:putative (di)nucleoside polyphosphate hydrolase
MHGPGGYRNGVGVVLLNANNLVFAGRRRDERPFPWQMPQGGLQPGELAVEAVIREVREELGTDLVTIIDELPRLLRYDYPAPSVSKRSKLFRGQQHRWFLLRFHGTDDNIRIDTKHPEFAEWRWMEPDALVQAVVPFKQQVYREVFAYFANQIDESAMEAQRA